MKGFGAALEYNEDAPRVLATARGILLEEMIRIAERESIPVMRDEALATVFQNITPGSAIPQELFEAAARVFSWCYAVDRKFAEKLEGHGSH